MAGCQRRRATLRSESGPDCEDGGCPVSNVDRPYWRKSSRSSPNGGNCVEVAHSLGGVVLVRDSKDKTGPVLTFEPTAWRAFIEMTRNVA